VVEADSISYHYTLAIEFNPPLQLVALTVLVSTDPTQAGATSASIKARSAVNGPIQNNGRQFQANPIPQQVILTGPQIDLVEITGAYQMFSGRRFGRVVLTDIELESPAQAWTLGQDGSASERFPVGSGETSVPGSDLTALVIDPGGPANSICISRICITLGPSQAQVAELDRLKNNLKDSTLLWSQTGEVFEPNTKYRLTVSATAKWTGLVDPSSIAAGVPCVAYFQTSGPPALGVLDPPDDATAADFKTNISFLDLTRYVEQTVPPPSRNRCRRLFSLVLFTGPMTSALSLTRIMSTSCTPSPAETSASTCMTTITVPCGWPTAA